jgi:hypothetical protein
MFMLFVLVPAYRSNANRVRIRLVLLANLLFMDRVSRFNLPQFSLQKPPVSTAIAYLGWTKFIWRGHGASKSPNIYNGARQKPFALKKSPIELGSRLRRRPVVPGPAL